MLSGAGLHFPGDAEGLKEAGEVLKFKKREGKSTRSKRFCDFSE